MSGEPTSVRLVAASRTDVGRQRPGNEDAVLVTDDARLVAVADGMGGHQAGEVASATAVAVLLDQVMTGAAVDDAIAAANQAVWAKAAGDAALRGMGTTLTAGILSGATLLIGHVGDSRAYLLRDGVLRRLTTDHSVVAELMAAGEITEDEALVDPRRAMITRALGIDAAVEVDLVTVEVAPGDRLLLCSDGLTTMVRDDEITRILVDEPDRDRAADALVAAANAGGGADNITVVVADVIAGDEPSPSEVPAASAPAAPPDPFRDTEEVPVVAKAASAALADDPELDALRSAVGDVTPRRRWWQRRRK